MGSFPHLPCPRQVRCKLLCERTENKVSLDYVLAKMLRTNKSNHHQLLQVSVKLAAVALSWTAMMALECECGRSRGTLKLKRNKTWEFQPLEEHPIWHFTILYLSKVQAKEDHYNTRTLKQINLQTNLSTCHCLGQP